jgi:hypothetical protein
MGGRAARRVAGLLRGAGTSAGVIGPGSDVNAGGLGRDQGMRRDTQIPDAGEDEGAGDACRRSPGWSDCPARGGRASGRARFLPLITLLLVGNRSRELWRNPPHGWPRAPPLSPRAACAIRPRRIRSAVSRSCRIASADQRHVAAAGVNQCGEIGVPGVVSGVGDRAGRQSWSR